MPSILVLELFIHDVKTKILVGWTALDVGGIQFREVRDSIERSLRLSPWRFLLCHCTHLRRHGRKFTLGPAPYRNGSWQRVDKGGHKRFVLARLRVVFHSEKRYPSRHSRGGLGCDLRDGYGVGFRTRNSCPGHVLG